MLADLDMLGHLVPPEQEGQKKSHPVTGTVFTGDSGTLTSVQWHTPLAVHHSP